jgi:PKD repeat protein
MSTHANALNVINDDYEFILKRDLGPNYKEIIKKNNAAVELGSKINEMFYLKTDEKIKYPDYIGGLYINNNNELIVQFVENKKPSKNENEFKTYNDLLSMIKTSSIENVQYSYNELESIMNRLNSLKFNENVVGYYIDVINNKIVVEMLSVSKGNIDEFKKNILDSEMIIFKLGEKGVEELNSGQATPNCTLGFRAKMGTKKGFVTAAHCMDGIAIGAPYYNLGVLRKSKNGGKIDAAFVETSTTINRTLQYPVWPATTLMSTAGYEPNLIVGANVGKSGKTTKGTIGKVESLSATWTGSPNLTNMLKANYKSDRGDSGAPVFLTANGQLVGVHKGTINSSKYSSRYNNVKNSLGITIY